MASGHVNAVADVAVGLAPIERLEVVPDRDPLAQARSVEDVAEFRLADQDDLKQFLLIGLQIRSAFRARL